MNWVELINDRDVMAAGRDGILREWRLEAPFQSEQRCPEIGGLRNAQLGPKGRWLLVTGERGSAQLYDLGGPAPVLHSLSDSSDTDHAAFAPDGTRLVLARTNGALDLWDVSSEPKRLRSSWPGRVVFEDVGFSTDGRSLLVVNLDGNARSCLSPQVKAA